jgi:tetratricopeptide (TPR) repeat protein
MSMHNRRALGCALLLFCVGAHGVFAQEGNAVSKANEEYNAGRFREAMELYEGAVKSGQMNAALFYNLGNASFKAGDLGRAILNYERALVLEPQHPEADANLRLARDKARALDLPSTWWDRLTARASATHYAIAASASFWIAAFALAALIFARRRSAKLMSAIVISLLSLSATIAALYVLETGKKGSAVAIVTAPNIQARLATADTASTVLVLPAGSKIKILSTRGDWTYAALPNNLRGWIPAESAERIRM